VRSLSLPWQRRRTRRTLSSRKYRSADAVIEEVPVSGYNWSGLYVGAGVGVGAVVHRVEVVNPDIGVDFNGLGGEGVFGELTIGYDYMVSPRFLIGAFADAHYGNIGPELNALGGLIDAELTNTYGFDVGARVGYLLNPSALGYVLGGYTWQRFELDGSLLGGAVPFEFEEDRDGYVVGVGMETVLTGNWTIKTEYRYANYGDDTVFSIDDPDGDTDINVEPSTHTFHAGVNYRFGAQDGGAALEAPAYNWTGFYIGGALGAGAVVYDISIDPLATELDGIGGEGIFGELNVGYDHDFGNFVAGVMVDGRYSGIKSELDINLGGPSVGIDGNADYGFDILARAGVKVNESTLAYVIGGYSWQNFEIDVPNGGGIDDIEWDSSGFSIGGGLEAAVTDNMTVNLEYRYSQFDSEDFDTGGFIEAEPSFQTVRIGAKYKFN
jgi:outer membrane immunogenic protein